MCVTRVTKTIIDNYQYDTVYYWLQSLVINYLSLLKSHPYISFILHATSLLNNPGSRPWRVRRGVMNPRPRVTLFTLTRISD